MANWDGRFNKVNALRKASKTRKELREVRLEMIDQAETLEDLKAILRSFAKNTGAYTPQ